MSLFHYFFVGCAIFFAINLVQSWKKYTSVVVNPTEKLKFVFSWELSAVLLILVIIASSSFITSALVDPPLFKSALYIIYCGMGSLALLTTTVCCLIFLCEKLELRNSMKLLDLDEKILDKLASEFSKNHF